MSSPLNGSETLLVQGQDLAGHPAGEKQLTTTGAIAALASSTVGVGEARLTSITTVGNGTLTAAALTGGLISRSGPTAAYSDATATAVALVAAIPDAFVGQSWYVTIKNVVAFAQTLTAGVGVTLPSSVIIPANSTATYLVTLTSLTAVTFVHVTNGSLISPLPQAVGATLTITDSMSGRPILLDTAAGSVATLPPATGSGSKYRFIVSTTVTSNSHKVLAASVSDFITGIAMGYTGSTAKIFGSNGATNHSLQMPSAGTNPSGGFIGDYFELIDIGANLWECSGMYQAGVTPTTPFSTATT